MLLALRFPQSETCEGVGPFPVVIYRQVAAAFGRESRANQKLLARHLESRGPAHPERFGIGKFGMNYIGEARERETVEGFLSLRTEESFQSLFEALYPRLHRHFIVRGLDSRDAEELAQNVMFLVYRRVAQLRDGASFYGWLFQIARNEYLHHIRRNCASLATVEYEPLSGWLAETLPAPAGTAGKSSLAVWLSHLEATEREILLLHFAEDLGYREIAAILDIPLGTVKWRVFNAKAKLAEVRKKEAGQIA